MDLKQIEAFCRVVELNSFSKAAERIFLTQPTVSSHIIALEKELGTKLLIRSTKKIMPTQAGRVFYDYAKGMLELKDRAIFALSDFSNDIKGSIEIVASSVPAQYVIPEVLPDFRSEYPNISFTIKQTDSGEAIDQVLSGEFDIGLAGARVENAQLTYEAFLHDPIVVIVPANEKYLSIESIDELIEILPTESYVIRELGSATRKRAEEFLINAGIDPETIHVTAQMGSTESVIFAVYKGLGISIVSEKAASDYAALGRIRAFSMPNEFLKRDLYIVYRKDRMLSPISEAFVSFIKTFYSVK